MMSSRTFHYTARTSEGKHVRGSMEAAEARNVLELLRSRALFVTSVDVQSDFGERCGRLLRSGGASNAGLLTFFRSFATLIRAGVSIQRALAVTIERASDARLNEALRSVLADVEHGTALSAALRRRPHDFPALYVAMIAAGEAGGILDGVLDRLAQLLEREAALSKKVQTALAYPAIVITAATSLTIFLCINVLPTFTQLLESFHVELPLTTRILVRLGEFLAAPYPWLLAAAGAAGATLAVYRAARTSAGALFFDHLRLHVPVLGPLLRKAISARVVRILGTLLGSGVELVAAIDAVTPVAGSPCYARAFARVNAGLRQGEALAQPLAESDLFDPMFVALVRAGEETGSVDEMLLKLADYFDRDVEAAIATLGAVIEPAIIIVLGAVVGFMVFSIFLPLYSLVGSLSK